MQRAHPSLLVLFCLLTTVSAAEKGNSNEFGRWQLEISGGPQLFFANDVNLFTQAENRYLDLYFRDNPYCSVLNDPGLSNFRYALNGRIRLRYQLNRRFRLCGGLHYLYGNNSNSARFSFQRDNGWRTLTDSLDYQALDTRLDLVFPHLGLTYQLPVGTRTDLELGLSAGLVWATLRLERHIVDSIQARELDPVNEYLVYQGERSLSMKGRGSGFGINAELKLNRRVNRHLGVFLETGYSFYHLPRLRGPSSELAGGRTRSWDGEWFLIGERVEKSWGSGEFYYPSNDPSLAQRRGGDFFINLHGFISLQFGILISL